MTLRTYLQERAGVEYFSAHTELMQGHLMKIRYVLKVSNLKFDSLTFVNMKITVFWDVLRCVFVRKLPTFRTNLRATIFTVFYIVVCPSKLTICDE